MPKKSKVNHVSKNLLSVSPYFSSASSTLSSANKTSSRQENLWKRNDLKYKHEEESINPKRGKYMLDSSDKEYSRTSYLKSPIKIFLYKKSTETNNLDPKENLQPITDVKEILETKRDSENETESSDNKCTPLLKQYLEFQKKYPDSLLMLECGTSYKIFGKDAEIASKILEIGLYQYHNFSCASVLSQNLYYYMRYLVLHGCKVAVIKQTNLEVPGENRLLYRKLHAMYTNSTFIGRELVLPGFENVHIANFDASDMELNCLLCLHESYVQQQINIVHFAIVVVQVISSDVFYVSFQDSTICSELENYLLCLKPSEILIPASISCRTENLINSLFCDKSTRIQKLDEKVFQHPYAMTNMSNFVHETENRITLDGIQEHLQALLTLDPFVVSCLSALKNYLIDFKLEKIIKNIKNIKPLSVSGNMLLSAPTIKGLELLNNKSCNSDYATLFWAIDRTSTKFGKRMLKLWIRKPLNNYQNINERLDIITEIIHSDSIIFGMISKMMLKLPDLERHLCSAFYHKCSCNEFLNLIQALKSIKKQILEVTDLIESEIKHPKLKSILLYILKHLQDVEKFLSNINQEHASLGNKIDVFYDITKYPQLLQSKSEVFALEGKLKSLQATFSKIFDHPVGYTTVNGQKYFIQVPNHLLWKVPNDWLKFSVTKQVSRFRSPEVIDLCKKLDYEQKKLEIAANEAWNLFLDEFSVSFYEYKQVVCYLAELDCYFSFARLTKEGNYCRPIIKCTDREFNVIEGYHPVTAKLLKDGNQFVCNGIEMNETQRCLIITGPNMGGKSTYVRQLGIIAVMAHMGCYVPATAAVVPLLDGIYVRMGADDDIINNRSTFLSEMSEASCILSSVDSNALVIMDELGRGTSTYDGAAIAFSTLEYLVNDVKCMTLFITHYPEVLELKEKYSENIIPINMSYILKEIDATDEIEYVTFLYAVERGVCSKGYGINVAGLAGISKDLLSEAAKKSKGMELKLKIHGILQKLHFVVD